MLRKDCPNLKFKPFDHPGYGIQLEPRCAEKQEWWPNCHYCGIPDLIAEFMGDIADHPDDYFEE